MTPATSPRVEDGHFNGRGKSVCFAALRHGCFLLVLLGLMIACPVSAATGKVIKVLPQFLDAQGRHALSPSLFERDAYQAYLRKHPKEESGLRLAVQWKARRVNWNKVRLRAELRGVLGNTLQSVTLETSVKPVGLFSYWSEFRLEGEAFRKFGDLAAWRVTLWEGDRQLGALQSFMWSAVGERVP